MTAFRLRRWSDSFVIPSLQTLQDVLALALRGEDPTVVDAMLRKRGDYRPHERFGVDLAARPPPRLCAATCHPALPRERPPWLRCKVCAFARSP